MRRTIKRCTQNQIYNVSCCQDSNLIDIILGANNAKGKWKWIKERFILKVKNNHHRIVTVFIPRRVSRVQIRYSNPPRTFYVGVPRTDAKRTLFLPISRAISRDRNLASPYLPDALEIDVTYQISFSQSLTKNARPHPPYGTPPYTYLKVVRSTLPVKRTFLITTTSNRHETS